MDLDRVFYSWHFDKVIERVNVVAGLNPERDTYATASNASAVCTYIKKLAKLLRNLYDIKNDSERIAEIGRFIYLHEVEYSEKIGRTA